MQTVHSELAPLTSAQRQLVEQSALEIQDIARSANEGVGCDAQLSSRILQIYDRFGKYEAAVCEAMVVDFSIVLSQMTFVMSGGQPAFRDAMRFARQEAVRLRRAFFVSEQQLVA